jgi:hypothetical protein
MTDWENVVSRLYSDFILRDLLSFVAPGAILLGSFLYLFLPISGLYQVFNQLNPFLFILFFGICYVIGIGLLIFGDADDQNKSKTSKWYSIPKNKFPTYYTDTPCDQQKKVKCLFVGLTNPHTKDNFLKIRERYVIFMQTCGNCHTALYLSFFLIVAKTLFLFYQGYFEFDGLSKSILLLLTLFGVIISVRILYKGHFVYKEMLEKWDGVIGK